MLMNNRAGNRPQEFLPMGMVSDEYGEEARGAEIRVLGRGDREESAGCAL